MRRNTLTRRFFIAATPALAWPAQAAEQQTGKLAFAVFRKGSNIGSHEVVFDRAGDDLNVRIAVAIAVGLGPITLYRYSLKASETWRRGVLMEAAGDTVDGGNRKWMRLARQNGKLVVEGTKAGHYIAPENSITASHWNRAELQAPMIDVQDGELLDFAVAARGKTAIEARGKTIEAAHFTLTGPARLDLYYDDADTWSGLRALKNDDSTPIEYRQL